MTLFQTIFFPPQHTPSTGCTDCTVSKVLYILILIGPKGTHRLYSAVCTVLYSLYILKLIGHKGTYRLYNVYSLKLIVNTGTNSIVSDLGNILKMIGLEGTLSVYSLYCVAYPTVLSVWFIYKTQTSRDSKTFPSATRGFPTLLSWYDTYMLLAKDWTRTFF